MYEETFRTSQIEFKNYEKTQYYKITYRETDDQKKYNTQSSYCKM